MAKAPARPRPSRQELTQSSGGALSSLPLQAGADTVLAVATNVRGGACPRWGPKCLGGASRRELTQSLTRWGPKCVWHHDGHEANVPFTLKVKKLRHS